MRLMTQVKSVRLPSVLGVFFSVHISSSAQVPAKNLPESKACTLSLFLLCWQNPVGTCPEVLVSVVASLQEVVVAMSWACGVRASCVCSLFVTMSRVYE